MKKFLNVGLFEKQSEIDLLNHYKNFEIGKVRVYQRGLRNVKEAIINFGECFISMSVEIFKCLFAFIEFLFCWIPYVGIDCVKEKKSKQQNLQSNIS